MTPPEVFGGKQNAPPNASHPYLPAPSRLMADCGASGRAEPAIRPGADNHLRAAPFPDLPEACPPG